VEKRSPNLRGLSLSKKKKKKNRSRETAQEELIEGSDQSMTKRAKMAVENSKVRPCRASNTKTLKKEKNSLYKGGVDRGGHSYEVRKRKGDCADDRKHPNFRPAISAEQ